MVIVPLGSDGQVSMFNATGSTDVLVDVLGWFPQGAGFNGLSPRRLMDTRAGGSTFDGGGQAGGGVAARSVRTLTVGGRAGVPATGVGSVVLNVTAVDPTAASYLTAWPTGFTQPTASNLNVVPGDAVANLVVVPIGADGTVSLYNDAGTTHLVVDVLGFFST